MSPLASPKAVLIARHLANPVTMTFHVTRLRADFHTCVVAFDAALSGRYAIEAELWAETSDGDRTLERAFRRGEEPKTTLITWEA